MHRLTEWILRHKWMVLLIFGVAAAASVILSRLVDVNYDLVKYLPDDSPSTLSLTVMDEAFDTSPPNVRVMIRDVTVPKALAYKERMAAVAGVQEIYWLDDAADVNQPLDLMDQDILDSWYRDGSALMTLLVKDDGGQSVDAALDEIRGIIGERGAMAGDAVNISTARQATSSEIKTMFVILLPVLLLILLLSTSSWFEPALFLITIGVSILLNSGTNVLLGEVSFITRTSAAVLQLAVSMDYSIFLLHRFAEYRKQGLAVANAMAQAMKSSFSSILASGMTTIIGFAALTVMRFKIGPDMGIVLAKGVLLSLVTVVLLLPVLTVLTYRLIDRTHHRPLMPSFQRLGRAAVKISLPVLVLVAAVLAPAFLAQRSNSFLYGASVMTSGDESEAGQQARAIDELFGKSNQMVLLVPEDDLPLQVRLVDALYEIPHVSSVTGYVTAVSARVPTQYLPEGTLSRFVSGGYSRLVLNIAADQESQEAFDSVEAVRSAAGSLYGGDYYLTGGSVNVYDMRETVIRDNQRVALISVVAIGLTILLIFRSLSLPLILLVTIESAIWINLSFPYFEGQQLSYLGYMIISSVQLGATVDYAILFATRYRELRQTLPRREAAARTVSVTTVSILTSAGILTASGFIMGAISTNGVIGQLGVLIGRGALMSALMVLLLLPALLILCDRIIEKTTLGTHFHKEVQP